MLCWADPAKNAETGVNAATRPRLTADAPRGAWKTGNVLIGVAAVLLALLAARVLVLLVAAEAAVPAVAGASASGSRSGAIAPGGPSPSVAPAPSAGALAPTSAANLSVPTTGPSPQPATRPAARALSASDNDYDVQEADPHLLAEVARRQAVLDRREQALTTRAAQVAAAEKLATQEIAELTRLRAQLEKLLNAEQTGANTDLAVLVGLYRNMKPQQAAAVLGKLDPPSAAAILEHLDTREAGPIVAAMNPNAALALTEALEKRRAAFRQ